VPTVDVGEVPRLGWIEPLGRVKRTGTESRGDDHEDDDGVARERLLRRALINSQNFLKSLISL